MRGGLSAIQQTLTPEAATVLTHSIAEAARRSHGQTTPLHVAATLLSAPTGLLRQACIRSHPNSSHPLQCRALELCFSVALDRLPTAQSTASPPPEPPLSNALVAALKRAQAHQRRGCPEQQQQPLLAVKVELEQLIISILDDPSVSRVMKEASFSSPAVKAAIEQAISAQPSTSSGPRIGLGFRPGAQVGVGVGVAGRSLYLNPRLQQQQQGSNVNVMQPGQQGREEDVKKVMDILGKPSKRNPILVGESEPQEVVKEVLRRVEKIRDGVLKNLKVVCIQQELGGIDKVLGKVKELGGLIERKMLVNSNGVIVDLGDLKWLVDQHQPANLGISELAREAVAEMGKILRKFCETMRVWFIGTATCETYLRCQVYHPTMETEWDLQVVSIVAKPPRPGILPRLGSNGGILSSSVECLTPMRSFPMAAPPLTRRVSENLDPLRRFSCCPQCTEKCNEDLAKLTAGQAEKSSSEVKSNASEQPLPVWLQSARLSNDTAKGATDPAQNKDQDLILRLQREELQKKWRDTCLQLHPNFHRGVSSERIGPTPFSMTSMHINPNLLGRQSSQPKLQQPKSLADALQLNISLPLTQQISFNRPSSPLESPVGTDLMLGLTKSAEKAQVKAGNHGFKDLVGCISSESQNNKVQESQGSDRPVTLADADSFKKLFKVLMEVVSWQKEAASAIASTIAQCKSGSGKLRAGGSKGDIWLLFSGPDRIGKKKMAVALSELVCGMGPILISLGSRRDGDESDLNFRGKTVIDRIAEAVRRNPFSVIMLQDIDEADMLVRGNIKRAMERGRLVDSHGREISLGNVIFIVTTNWVPGQQKGLSGGGVTLNEEKLISLASGGWQLRISIGEKPTGKRPPSWLHDNDDQGRAAKRRKEMGLGLSFDLNKVADTEDDRLDGSHNSSDLTVDHEEDHVHQNREAPATTSIAHELLGCIDEAIIFKPVDFTPIRQNMERTITGKFLTILGDKFSFMIENEALEKIMSGVWLGQTALELWVEKVLVPSFHQLKATLLTLPPRGSPEGKMVVRLELDNESGSRDHGDWLPGRVSVAPAAQ